MASNDLSGTIPENLSSLTALEALDLSSNHLTGTLPLSLCNSSNPLSDLLVNSNQLQGTIDVSSCVNLFYLDCSRNQFNGTVMGPPAENNRLHEAYITDNQITNFTDFISSGLLTDLVLDRNPIPDDSLLPQLTVLQALHSFSVVNQDFDAPNYLSGTLPASVLTLGSLRSINLKSQAVYGSLPAINGALDLTQLSLSFNCVSGTIPASVARVLSARSSILDLRLNFLSCCAVGPLDISDWTVTNVSYNSYDLSLPRLPRGIKFSSTLQPVTQPLVSTNGTFAGSQINLANRTYPGLNCPYLLRADDEDVQYNFLSNWYLDPEYTLFEGCQCDPGLVMVRSIYRGGLPVVECVTPPPPSDPWWVRSWWIFLIVGAFAFAVLIFVVWKASSGARSKLLQEFFDAQKRAKGAPSSGQISIVVTDIEGFSKLMKNSPELTMQATILHNDLIQKARHSNFGYLIESEGDSFSILFESPVDAVKFCIQSQLLFASASWPKGLFDDPAESHDRPSDGMNATGAVVRTMHSFMGLQSPFLSFTKASSKPDVSVKGGAANVSSPIKSRGSEEIVMMRSESLNSPTNIESLSRTSPRHFQGLHVRMGVATGTIESPTTPASSFVLELAKSISDTACGGQVLMDAATFDLVKDLTEELGCVTESGTSRDLMRSNKKGKWSIWGRRKKTRSDKYVILLLPGGG